MLPLTPVAEQYSAAMIMRARNAPPKLPVNPVEDGNVLNNLMSRAENHFLGEFHQARAPRQKNTK